MYTKVYGLTFQVENLLYLCTEQKPNTTMENLIGLDRVNGGLNIVLKDNKRFIEL
jgi:hypothetical protein